MLRVFYFFKYVVIFLVELVLANFQVLRLVLSPRPRFSPAFISVPLTAESDFEIAALANSVTLTPGTISVHVSRDHKTLIVHVLNMEDREKVRQSIKQNLEANILSWTRADPPAPSPSASPAHAAAAPASMQGGGA